MKRFEYTQFSEEAKRLDLLLATYAINIEDTMEKDFPQCRETSLALTKLEEMVMWARKALRGVE